MLTNCVRSECEESRLRLPEEGKLSEVFVVLVVFGNLDVAFVTTLQFMFSIYQLGRY
jgi:hypothetical protein